MQKIQTPSRICMENGGWEKWFCREEINNFQHKRLVLGVLWRDLGDGYDVTEKQDHYLDLALVVTILWIRSTWLFSGHCNVRPNMKPHHLVTLPKTACGLACEGNCFVSFGSFFSAVTLSMYPPSTSPNSHQCVILELFEFRNVLQHYLITVKLRTKRLLQILW